MKISNFWSPKCCYELVSVKNNTGNITTVKHTLRGRHENDVKSDRTTRVSWLSKHV